MSLRLAVLAVCLAGLAGCAHAMAPAAKATPAPTAEVDYRCKVDADCAVKDIGNCCGHYPACVNKDSPTFPERVAAECARTGMSGVCGYPVISGCRCVAERCTNVTDGGEVR